MFIELVDKGLEGVFDVEQFCLDNNIDVKKVISLYCYKNKLTEIKGLEKLVNLEFLHCGNNNLTELNVSKLVNLVGLRCYNNKLTELKGLDKLVNLEWLNGLEYKQPELEPVILYKLDLLINKIEKLEQIISELTKGKQCK